jgi:signal transduction histidine kinase
MPTMTDHRLGRRPLLSSHSVRTRIIATVALLVALALAVSGLVVYALGRERVDDTVREAVAQEMAEVEEFEENARDVRTGGRYTSIPRLVRGFLSRDVPTEAELWLAVWDGKVQYASATSRDGLLRDAAFLDRVLPKVRTGGAGRVDSQWGEIYYEVLPIRDTQRSGALVAAYFVDDELAPLHATMRSYAVTAAVALVLVTAVAAWQAGRLLSPVRTLRETAEEIGETDLSRRIPVTGNDDLTDLTRTVNAMLARLEHAFAGQRAFLDDAGHELRTPLTSLRARCRSSC